MDGAVVSVPVIVRPGPMRPNERLMRALGQMYPQQELVRMKALLDDLTNVDGLARLLDKSMTACTKGDGNLDLRELAAHMLRTLMENQR
jgi:hypothetical protein